jgi:hypothetical protein
MFQLAFLCSKMQCGLPRTSPEVGTAAGFSSVVRSSSSELYQRVCHCLDEQTFCFFVNILIPKKIEKLNLRYFSHRS